MSIFTKFANLAGFAPTLLGYLWYFTKLVIIVIAFWFMLICMLGLPEILA